MSALQRIDATAWFNLAVARKLATAAEMVYRDPEDFERVAVDQWKADSFVFWDVDATQCFVTASPSEIVVCFRGTEMDALEDWLVDLDFDLIEGPLDGRVHAGFYDALSCTWHSLDRHVEQLQHQRSRPLWVTGHSMGAALAVLATSRWLARRRVVSGLYTFGQPRTGDRKFARDFDFRLRPHAFRLVNRHDIVTRTPPRSMGYRHLGTFLYLEEEAGISADVGWWRHFLDGWQGGIESLLEWGGGGIEDHRMSTYCQRLDQLLIPQAIAMHSLPVAETNAAGDLIRPRRRAA
jgi:triacylglycerol lipase